MHRPKNYVEMEHFFNQLSRNDWRGLTAAYAFGGIGGIINYLRQQHTSTLLLWGDMDLYHYLVDKKLTDFTPACQRQ